MKPTTIIQSRTLALINEPFGRLEFKASATDLDVTIGVEAVCSESRERVNVELSEEQAAHLVRFLMRHIDNCMPNIKAILEGE